MAESVSFLGDHFSCLRENPHMEQKMLERTETAMQVGRDVGIQASWDHRLSSKKKVKQQA